MNDIEILNFILKNSIINKKENNEYIYDIEILDDEIKRNETIIEKAKKKLLNLKQNKD